jgi:ATP-dependent DNA helicase RecQ
MYPILTFTEKSEAVLKGDQRVLIVQSKEKIEGPVAHTSSESLNYEVELFQQLKAVRRELANAENVPAYIVLSDASLIELAAYLPHNREEFSKISGFGQYKIEKYGKRFWEVVGAYCRANNLGSRIHLKAPKRQRKIQYA